MTPDLEQLGTLNAIDRSKQYTQTDNRELLRSLNEAWTKIRLLEQAARGKDRQIHDLNSELKKYKLVNIVLTSIITGLAWEGLKALVVHLHLLQ